MLAEMAWNITVGEEIARPELHKRFGGRLQGRISPSKQSPNILLFSDRDEQYGAITGWHADGCYNYIGEGQTGAQQMTQGNKAVLEHAAAGKALRLFFVDDGFAQYVGEFTLDARRPFYKTDAPDINGEIRTVIVFRLRPIGPVLQLALPPDEQDAPGCSRINANSGPTETFTRAYVDVGTAERIKEELIRDYLSHCRKRGHVALERLRIHPEDEVQILYSDLLDAAANRILVAEGAATREAVRRAIGRLMDYCRFRPGAKLAVLLPVAPRHDLLELLHFYDIQVIARCEDGSFGVL